jgi:hypothetical protein
MKGLCYIALIIGFFIFYQQNPVYAIIIIIGFIGLFLFFKSRKFSSKRGGFGFLSGRQASQDNRMDDLITLIMLQQLMNSNSNGSKDRIDQEEDYEFREKYIEQTKKEILDLLDEG